ncbi:AraC family transcriptional regulator [Algoriphagus sp. NG3]|uniref:helix-turn-helix domain-containing protein n=1 Tax=Algoriphagus sp. NG3 TaxID=3097546 RepID=UPI002A83468F|nr:AraC family transcriptional regulator [Algoriphagus sp. NG3]WPR76600.1 AraC family transcriptional regulator [Algoriphagus sp. NG3]
MPNSPFKFSANDSEELQQFPQIKEIGFKINNSIKLNSFFSSRAENLRVYLIVEGKFEWVINSRHELLYPGDVAIILPGQEIGGLKGYIGIGAFYWLQLKLKKTDLDNKIDFGKWSRLSKSERNIMWKILSINESPVINTSEIIPYFQEIRNEISGQEFGYVTRVNHLLDSMLILICRLLTIQAGSRRDFPQIFTNLEKSLRKNLSHKWTVEEMAAMVGMGCTAFTEKVKSYTGFPPLHYLINIRITEAIKLLKLQEANITDIALETGFYSSQHFSTTFKKLTGHTPNEFRKQNSPKE